MLPLTTDRAAHIDAVRDMRRFDPPNENVRARMNSADGQAALVLLTDGRPSGGNECVVPLAERRPA